MDIMTFRVMLDRLLRNKSKELQIKVKEEVEKVLCITQKEYISDETIALIILTQEAELQRISNA